MLGRYLPVFHEQRNFTTNMEYDFSVKKFASPRDEKRSYSLHYHNEFEFIYMLEGEMDIFVKDTFYHVRKGDVFAIPSLAPHFTNKTGAVSYLLLIVPVINIMSSFAPELCVQFTDKNLYRISFYKDIKADPANADRVASIFSNLYQLNTEQTPYHQYLSLSYIHQLLVIYLSTSNANVNANLEANFKGLNNILTYIEQNIGSKIELKTLAELTNYSYTYVSKMFSKTMGMSLNEYIIHRRIKTAKCMLASSSTPVTDIAMQCGFTNSNDIYKKFAKYVGTTPLKYRQQVQERQLTEISRHLAENE